MQRTSREAVLDAVAETVRDLGVRRTTMSEIARRAGVSRSTLYTHVADVREAAAALLTRELLLLLAEASDDGSDATPDDASGVAPDAVSGEPDGGGHGRRRIVGRALRMARTVPDHPLVERILELDGELLVPYLVRSLGSSQRAILDAVTIEVRRGQQDGSIRAGDPALIAFSVFLVTQAFVISARIAEAEHGREAALGELALLLDRTLAPVAAP
jgi:AcrR family transcriptional regulator